MSQRTSFNTCGLKVLNHNEIFVLFYKYLKKTKRKLHVTILKVETNVTLNNFNGKLNPELKIEKDI